MGEHIPVLADEVMQGLQLRRGETVIDATLGAGGHAKRMLEAIGPSGRLLGIDQDANAIAQGERRFAGNTNTELFHGNFREIRRIAAQCGIRTADAVLLDLGFSSDQMGDPARGLSFQAEGPLDMRLGQDALTAHEVVNHWDRERLAGTIFELGQERYSRRIARAIVAQRPIQTTTELAEVVRRAYPPAARHGRIDPATRTFQALRIAVNDELGALQDCLAQLPSLLSPGGRVAVISFHSLEDGIVKAWMRAQASEDKLTIVTKKPIVASEGERQQNPRSRSAKLRIAAKKTQP